jgi:hypothetical protein
MMADELKVNKGTIRQIPHEDLRKKNICEKFPHRRMDEQRQRKIASCQDFVQTCQDNPSFLHCIFLFPKAKTVLKGKGFQDVEDFKKNVTAELTAILWRPLSTALKNVLNDSTNIFM